MSLEQKNKKFMREIFSQSEDALDAVHQVLKRSGALGEGVHFYEGRARFGRKLFKEMLRLCEEYYFEKELLKIDFTDDESLPDWAMDFSELRIVYKM